MTSPACPGTFIAAMQHPVWGVCILAAARNLQAVQWPGTKPHPAAAASATPAPRGAYHSRRPPQHAAPAGVDLKRAAANDRDD